MSKSHNEVATAHAKEKRFINLVVNAARTALKELGLKEGEIDLLLNNSDDLQFLIKIEVNQFFYDKRLEKSEREDEKEKRLNKELDRLIDEDAKKEMDFTDPLGDIEEKIRLDDEEVKRRESIEKEFDKKTEGWEKSSQERDEFVKNNLEISPSTPLINILDL